MSVDDGEVLWVSSSGVTGGGTGDDDDDVMRAMSAACKRDRQDTALQLLQVATMPLLSDNVCLIEAYNSQQ